MKTMPSKNAPALSQRYLALSSRGRKYFADESALTISPVDVQKKMEKEDAINIVDVRDSAYYQKGHIPGAQNLPTSKWSEDASPLRRDKVNIFYGYSDTCHLAAMAAEWFTRKGFRVLEMEGGFVGWKENQLPVETVEAPHGQV